LCSTYEGFPVALLEYGFAKLPVISSNVGFCSEVILHKKTGLLFNPMHLQELVLQLGNLKDDFNLRGYLSEELNNLVVSNFSKETIIANLIIIYNSINEK
ncbi:glycosyltransferase, partial [Flavobacterium psychrophilum]|nr:glycosyltransferase [Flavobacterium psychrophilum]